MNFQVDAAQLFRPVCSSMTLSDFVAPLYVEDLLLPLSTDAKHFNAGRHCKNRQGITSDFLKLAIEKIEKLFPTSRSGLFFGEF